MNILCNTRYIREASDPLQESFYGNACNRRFSSVLVD